MYQMTFLVTFSPIHDNYNQCYSLEKKKLNTITVKMD